MLIFCVFLINKNRGIIGITEMNDIVYSDMVDRIYRDHGLAGWPYSPAISSLDMRYLTGLIVWIFTIFFK